MAAAASIGSSKEADIDEDDLAYLTRYGPARKVSRGRQICICVIAYSPKRFYLVTDDDMLQNLRFTHQMERLYAQDLHFLNFSELVVGMPVAARYIGGDLAWYRARLVSFDVTKNQCQVEFVDYAHSQSNNLQQLRSMPIEIAKYPPMALECKLIGSDDIADESPEINKEFRDILFKKWPKGKCLASFLTGSPPYAVRLWNANDCVELTWEDLGVKIVSKRSPIPSTTTAINSDGVSPLLVAESASTDNALKVDFLLMSDTTNSGTIPKTDSMFPVNCQNGSVERQPNNAANNSVSPNIIVQNGVSPNNDNKNAIGVTPKKVPQDGTPKSTRRDAAVGDNLIHEKIKNKNLPSTDMPELINCLFPKLGQLLASDKP